MTTHNVNAYRVLSDSHKYFTFGNNIWSSHLCLCKYSLFSRHTYFWKSLWIYELHAKYLKFGSHICSFHIYYNLSNPCLVHICLQMPMELPITFTEILIWKRYLFGQIYDHSCIPSLAVIFFVEMPMMCEETYTNILLIVFISTIIYLFLLWHNILVFGNAYLVCCD